MSIKAQQFLEQELEIYPTGNLLYSDEIIRLLDKYEKYSE